MTSITPEQEKIVETAEQARAAAIIQKEKIWESAVEIVKARGFSEYQSGFWNLVETEAGEPYRKADAAVRACYTEEVKRLLPAVRAARKAREQEQAYALYGRGYDTDGGSGYGANASD
jgi:hypothetical protein